MKGKTTEQFKQEVYELVGDEYTVLGEYVNSMNKLRMRHNTCGNEYEVRPNDFISKNRRCPQCFGLFRRTTEQFKQEVYDLVGDEYTVLGEYVNDKTKIRIKHNTCGNEYEVRPNDFTSRGRRCPQCSIISRSNNRKLNTEQFKQEVYDLVGDEYTVLGEYTHSKDTVKMRHNTCGYEYEITPHNFKNGHRCFECAKLSRREKMSSNTAQFKQEVYELVGDEYTVLGEYVNSSTKIRMKHNTCSYEYDVKPNLFKSGRRCPRCKESRGEKIIAEILDELNISYIREKTFKDCKYIGSLRFDFYIETLNLCIEYDGIQHFNEDVQFGTGNLEENQLRDRIKDEYCKKNNITLKRFNYKQFDKLEKLVRVYIKNLIK